jgi:hypothetical protein
MRYSLACGSCMKSEIEADEEITFLENRMRSVKMIWLPKTHEPSWWNGKDKPGPTKLDNAFAAEHLRFKHFDGKPIRPSAGWSSATRPNIGAGSKRFPIIPYCSAGLASSSPRSAPS